MAEKIQLAVPAASAALDNQRVIAQELDSIRKSTGKLPKLADPSALNAINKANVKLAASMEDKSGLPRVTGKVHDKMQATRRGAALMHALGKTEVERQMAKEEQEKKKRKARLEKAGQSASGNRGQEKGPPGSLSRSSTNVRGQDGKSGAASGAVTGRTQQSSKSTARDGRRSLGQGRGRNSLRRRHIQHTEESHGVREDSRVGKLLAEFGGRDDWVSTTVLKHQLATIIQANVRGWLVRLKWWANPDYVVDTLHAELHAQATESERRAKLKKELEIRSLSNKQKKVANTVVSKLFGPKHAGPGGAAGFAARAKSNKWGKLQKNADIAVQEIKEDVKETDKYTQLGLDPKLADMLGSDPDSEFSDLEMEDITAVKLRARTPPWQKQEESQWAGQYSKLIRTAAHSTLNMKWDLDACQERLDGCRARHRSRNPDQAQEDAKEFDPSSESLPPDVINSLLYPKYRDRMIRLGLIKPEDLPDPEELLQEQIPVQEMFADCTSQPPTLVLPSLNANSN